MAGFNPDYLSSGADLLNFGANLGLGIAGLKEQKKQNAFANQMAEKNFKFQQDAFEYQKQLNDLQMHREDTAVQRRAEDLKMAGINPVMAGGGSAVSQALHSAPAPQREITNQALDLSKLNALQMSQDFALKNLSAKLQKQEQARQDRLANSQVALNTANIGQVQALTDIYLLDKLYKSGSLSDRIKAENLKNEILKQNMFKSKITNAISYMDALNTFKRGSVAKGWIGQTATTLTDKLFRDKHDTNKINRNEKSFDYFLDNPEGFFDYQF